MQLEVPSNAELAHRVRVGEADERLWSAARLASEAGEAAVREHAAQLHRRTGRVDYHVDRAHSVSIRAGMAGEQIVIA